MVLPTSAEQLLENALPVCAFRVQMCGGDSRQGAWTFRGAATARHHAVCRSARARSSIGPPSRRLASPCESQQRRVAPVHRAACVPQTRSASWVEYGYRKRERGECGSAVLTAHQDLFQGPMFAVLCAEARSIRPGSVRLRTSHVAVAARRDAGRRPHSRGRVGGIQACSGSGSHCGIDRSGFLKRARSADWEITETQHSLSCWSPSWPRRAS